MTLRAMIAAAYTLLVEEFRRRGMGLHDALTAIEGLFVPAPERRQTDERAALRRNEAVMAGLASVGGALPRPVRTPKP